MAGRGDSTESATEKKTLVPATVFAFAVLEPKGTQRPQGQTASVYLGNAKTVAGTRKAETVW